jgi:predicted methyltransferase
MSSSLRLHLLFTLHHSQKPLSPWELVTLQDGTLGEFYDAFDGLRKDNHIVQKDGKVLLTPEGTQFLTSQVGDKKQFEAKCTDCEGKGYISKDPAFLEHYKKVLEKRPPPHEQYDQTSISAEDAIIRVAFFHERGDLVNKELLFIGDFDCLSIVAALTGLPKRIVVLDVDDRLISYINDVASQLPDPSILKAEKFDVRLPLPEHFQRSFDLFSCDPVETLEGIKLYLSRGTSGLRSVGSSAYIGLTTQEAGRKKWYDIEKILFDMNFVLTDVKRNFNGYPNTGLEEKHIICERLGSFPDVTWYWSALLRVELIDEPNPPITGKFEVDYDIYMDDEAWATPVLDNKQ